MSGRRTSAERALAAVLEHELPKHFPLVRDERPADVKKVVKWLEAGRAERAFKAGTPATPGTVARYRKEIEARGWRHRSWVIEQAGSAVGYLDARTRGSTAELLGLFLDRSVRDQKLGRHLIRWAVAALREEGCRRVTIEVYAENTVSLRACRAAGFLLDSRRDRYEGSRLVRRLRREVAPFIRFAKPDSKYTEIRGANLYLHHVAVADALAERLIAVPGVLAVLGLGSLWRGFADDLSDIDVAILGRGEAVKGLRTGERFVVGTSVDIFAVDVEKCPPSCWDENRRQAFGEAVVLARQRDYSLQQLRRSTSLQETERRELITDCLLSLGWIGYQPPSWIGRERYGYTWEVPYDVWLRRGSVDSAHATADKAFDLALQLLFLVNGRRVPDAKWRLFLAPGLPWQPRDLPGNIRVAFSTARNERGLHKRARAVRRIVTALAERLESEGVLDESLYGRFLRSASDYAQV